VFFIPFFCCCCGAAVISQICDSFKEKTDAEREAAEDQDKKKSQAVQYLFAMMKTSKVIVFPKPIPSKEKELVANVEDTEQEKEQEPAQPPAEEEGA